LRLAHYLLSRCAEQEARMLSIRGFVRVGAAAGLVACVVPTSDIGSQEQRDTWDPSTEDPASLLQGASAKLADNVLPTDVGKTFGVSSDRIPYPDTYWPFTDNGIDARWNGSEASPLEKLIAITEPSKTADAKTWERKHHGKDVPGVADWFGHCPGWTGASMSNPPIEHAVLAKSDGHGGITGCTRGESGCTKFEIGDVNALEAEVYVDADSSFLGARCDTPARQIKRDRNGRIVRDGTGCKGLNAGALLIVLSKRMKQERLPLAIDAQSDFNTDQIWNQPAYQYRVYGYRELTKSEAIRAVAERGPSPSTYTWNERAQGFVRVDVGIQWVAEHGPNLAPVSGGLSTRETRFAAVIELDGAPSDPSAKILGGEYLDDPSIGATRLTVPPFVWIANGIGPESLPPDVDGNSHNPYVKPSAVRTLVELGTR
jgi:hypothetical protein